MEDSMDKFIHRENLALLRKRLAEVQDDDARRVLLKLLAEEEAKDFPPPRDRSQNTTPGE
jgi:hypothetical protein